VVGGGGGAGGWAQRVGGGVVAMGGFGRRAQVGRGWVGCMCPGKVGGWGGCGGGLGVD